MPTIIPSLRVNNQRLQENFYALAEIGATPEKGVNRLALSIEDLAARSWFARRIEEAGLLLQDDEVGNLSGILSSKNRRAKTILIGSHLDTVPDGGRYDGAIGVLAALECLQTIKEAGLDLPAHLEAMNFTDVEGNWQSLFGSMGLAGMLTPGHINDAERRNGAFRAALFRAGIEPNEVINAARLPGSIAAFLELHIEQGRQLDRASANIGIVTGIVGRSTYKLTFYGQSAHAGTTKYDDRRDALLGAATFVTRAYEAIRAQYPEGIFNCGNLSVEPGAFNVIPAVATLLFECRHPDEEAIAGIEEASLRIAEECAQEHVLQVEASRILHRPAAKADPFILETIKKTCEQIGCRYEYLVSYAGHDAQIMSRIAPTGMIFVPSVEGISHNSREYTKWEDVEVGANVLLQTILELALQFP